MNLFKTLITLSAILLLSGCAGGTASLNANDSEYNVFGLSGLLQINASTNNITYTGIQASNSVAPAIESKTVKITKEEQW